MADLNSKENHSYNFRINADSTQAMEDLSALEEQIVKVQKRIDDLNKSKTKLKSVPVMDPKTGEPLLHTEGRKKGQPVTTRRRTAAEPDVTNKMSEMYYELNKSLGAVAKVSATLRRDKDKAILKGDKGAAVKAETQIKELADNAQKLNNAVMKQYYRLQDVMDADGANLGNRGPLNNASHLSQGTSEARTTLTLIKNLREEVVGTFNATERIANRAIGTGQINAAQASLYSSNLRKIASPDGEFQTTHKSNAIHWKATAESGLADAERAIDEFEALIKDANQRLKKSGISDKERVETNKALVNYKAALADSRQSRNAYKAAVETAQEVYNSLESTPELIKNKDLEVQRADITKIADRNDAKGRATERAFAIAASTQMAIAYQLKKAFNGGTSVWEGMQDSSISIGNRTGSYDYRGIRQSAQRSGLPYGYDGKTMLGFQDSILSSLGTRTPDEIMGMSDSLAAFTKTSGVSQDTSSALMQSIYRSGGASTAMDSKYIQDAIIGGIKASGMQGREEEQIKALNGILEAQYSGRSATNEEINSTLAMASMFSKEGGEAFQGANLQNFMASMSQAIKGSSMYSTQGLLLGSTTDPRYQGENGAYNFAVQREKGFNAENASGIIDKAMQIGGDAKDAAYIINQAFPTGVGTEDLAKLIEKMQTEGLKLDAETLKKYQDASATTGSDTTNKATEAYQDSSDYAKDLKELTQEMVNLNAADNDATKALNETLGKLNETLSKSTGGSIASAVVTGVVSGLMTSVPTILAGSYGTQIIRKFTTSKWVGAGVDAVTGSVPGVVTKASKITKAKGLFGKAKSGISGILKGSGDDIAESVIKTSGDDVAKSLFSNLGDDFLGLLGKGGKLFGAGAKGIGKIMPFLGAGMSALNIANADDKGNQIAKEGLGWGGAAAGAAIGTAIMPGIGTIIGGGIGAIGGSLAGESGLGDWLGEKVNGVGSWIKDLFNGDSTKDSEDKSNTTAKTLTEKQREANNSDEATNLSKQETLLGKIQTLLDQAKAQNGIIGVSSGTLGTGSSGGGTVANMSYTGSGEYWTNTDIKQHDLAVTSNTLTADQLNEWINSNASESSEMYGMGQAFLDAGTQSGLDPRYLVGHAALETGWGSEGYAKDGNFYGIGAFDSNPDNALKYGNASASTGIIEGAKWIAQNYYSQGQTTLDSMRNNGGTHEYATDPNWDEKIASIMKGAESYTKPSNTLNTTVNLNYTGTGNSTTDATTIANKVSTAIPTAYLQNLTRQA